MLPLDDATLLRILKEDVPYGDLTTRSLNLSQSTAKMTFKARYDMCLCASEEAARLLELIGCDVELNQKSGASIESGTLVLTAQGDIEKIFIGWKIAQTTVEWASGISTTASKLVQKAQNINSNCKIACTRKAIPGTRELSARAIISAGAVLHRNGLSDTVLLFPEHRAFAHTEDSLQEQVIQLKKQCPERSIVVEVKSIVEALKAIDAGADVIQLEKFTPDQISNFLSGLPNDGSFHIAAAGGINVNNVEEYAQTGVDILVTSSPYYAKPADIQVDITKD